MFLHSSSVTVCKPIFLWSLAESWPSWTDFSYQYEMVCVVPLIAVYDSDGPNLLLTVVYRVDLDMFNCFEITQSLFLGSFPSILLFLYFLISCLWFQTDLLNESCLNRSRKSPSIIYFVSLMMLKVHAMNLIKTRF